MAGLSTGSTGLWSGLPSLLYTTGLTTSVGLNADTFSPITLFSAGQQGAWYDPSDFSTMYQDSAGTTPVTAVEQPVGLIKDKSGRGNNASQATSASRPVLSARVNLLTGTATLATQSVTTAATSYKLAFSGTGSITLSGTATGTYTAGTSTFSATAGTLTLTVSGSVTSADLRAANDGVTLPAYQAVTNSTTYDTVGFPLYLKFDGTDDSLATSSINLTSTDKITVWAGLRKLLDGTTKIFVEFSADSSANIGTFCIQAPQTTATSNYLWRSTGTRIVENLISPYVAPITNVITGIGDISAPLASTRVNGGTIASVTTTQGTATYGNYPLYIGRRGGATLPYNGRLYGLIVRGAQSTPAQITAAEIWMNQRTRAY